MENIRKGENCSVLLQTGNTVKEENDKRVHISNSEQETKGLQTQYRVLIQRMNGSTEPILLEDMNPLSGHLQDFQDKVGEFALKYHTILS